MKEPTDEQIEWFWEQLGCRVVSFPLFLKESIIVFDLVFPDGEEQRFNGSLLDSIDLNNLFKYAVPKLVGEGYSLSLETVLAEEPWYWWIVEKGSRLYKYSGKDPALALFWAIYKAFGGKE